MTDNVDKIIRTTLTVEHLRRIHRETVRLHQLRGLDRDDDKTLLGIWNIIEEMEDKYRKRMEGER